MSIGRRVLVAMVVLVASTGSLHTAPAEAAPNWRANPRCQAYEQAMLAADAGPAVADRMAYRIAPRESGCSMQCVNDSDDWSCSWVGLNGKHGYWRTWVKWCGVDVRRPHSMYADARCAKIAHDKMGWRPWGGGR